jgi:hypothetical protein
MFSVLGVEPRALLSFSYLIYAPSPFVDTLFLRYCLTNFARLAWNWRSSYLYLLSSWDRRCEPPHTASVTGCCNCWGWVIGICRFLVLLRVPQKSRISRLHRHRAMKRFIMKNWLMQLQRPGSLRPAISKLQTQETRFQSASKGLGTSQWWAPGAGENWCLSSSSQAGSKSGIVLLCLFLFCLGPG